MNTEITLATELELSDVELEAVVGGRGSHIGSITIVNTRIRNQYNQSIDANNVIANQGSYGFDNGYFQFGY